MRLALATVAVAVLGLFLASSPVGANGMPIRYSPEPASTLWTWEHSATEILHEDLFVEFSDPPRIGGGEVNVVAVYRIKGGGPDGDPIPVAFIAHGSWGEWGVTLDGQPLAVETGFEVEGLDLRQQTYDPLTGGEYVTPVWGEPHIQAVVFHLPLREGVTHELRVQHRGQTGWDRYRYLNKTYHYSYFLSPAASWAGFGQLSITIKYPKGFTVVTSLDNYLDSPEPGVLAGLLPGLPGEDLHISMISRSGLLPGLASRSAAGCLWLGTLLVYGSSRVFSRSLRARLCWDVLLGLVSLWILTRDLWPYPFDVLQVPMLVVVLAFVGASEALYLRRVRRVRPTG